MKQFAATFLLVGFLVMEVTFVWMIWSGSQVAEKDAFTATIVFINALLICLGTLQ